MRAFVFGLVFLTAVFGQANSLSCIVCKEPGNPNCTGSPMVVPADATKCIMGMEINRVGESVIRTGFRGPLAADKPDVCGQDFYMTNSELTLAFKYSCCETDNCNNGPIQEPDIPTKPNGHCCRACFSQSSEPITSPCAPEKIMMCTGNQFQCATFNGSATRPTKPDEEDYYFRACITNGGCTIGLKSLPATVPGNYMLSCTSNNEGKNDGQSS